MTASSAARSLSSAAAVARPRPDRRPLRRNSRTRGGTRRPREATDRRKGARLGRRAPAVSSGRARTRRRARLSRCRRRYRVATNADTPAPPTTGAPDVVEEHGPPHPGPLVGTEACHSGWTRGPREVGRSPGEGRALSPAVPVTGGGRPACARQGRLPDPRDATESRPGPSRLSASRDGHPKFKTFARRSHLGPKARSGPANFGASSTTEPPAGTGAKAQGPRALLPQTLKLSRRARATSAFLPKTSARRIGEAQRHKGRQLTPVTPVRS